MTIIGDVNGKVSEYLKIIKSLKGSPSIQLGNFGLKKSYDQVLDYPLDVLSHNILMSHNDFYPYVDHTISMGDYNMDEYEGLLYGYIRGSEHVAIKTCNRVFPGQNIELYEDYCDLCFPVQEQLNDWDFMRIIDSFPKRNPKILLSSEVPQSIFEQLFEEVRSNNTRRNLEDLWQTWQPNTWVFSNYGKSVRQTINGTNFVGLSELETFKINKEYGQ